MSEIYRDGIMRERGEADLAAAVGHVNGLIDRRLGTGAFHDIVGANSAGEPFDDLDGILVIDIDGTIGTEVLANREPLAACSRQNHRACAKRLGNGYSQ